MSILRCVKMKGNENYFLFQVFGLPIRKRENYQKKKLCESHIYNSLFILLLSSHFERKENNETKNENEPLSFSFSHPSSFPLKNEIFSSPFFSFCPSFPNQKLKLNFSFPYNI
jgi:hypothetical protein